MALVVNGFTIGQDMSMTLRNETTGQVIPADQLGHLLEFDAQFITKNIDITPITGGGRPQFDTVFHGVSGKASFARINGALSQLFAKMMNDFFTLRIRTKFSITITVSNRDGTTDQYFFQGCSLSDMTFGDFRADKEVNQHFSFRASTMTVGGTGGALLNQLAF